MKVSSRAVASVFLFSAAWLLPACSLFRDSSRTAVRGPAVTASTSSSLASAEAGSRDTRFPPGLIVEDVIAGDGELVQGAGAVVLKLIGAIEAGDEFQRLEGPAGPWPREELIDGLDLGLEGMAVGGTRRTVIPPELGYGDTDIGTRDDGTPLIPGGSTLVYSVTLIDFMPDTQEASPASAQDHDEPMPDEAEPEEPRNAETDQPNE